MMSIKTLILFLCCGSSLFISAQSTLLEDAIPTSCATDAATQLVAKQEPETIEARRNYELRYKKAMDSKPLTAHSKTNMLLTIPTVVHIIHNGEALGSGPNLTDERIAQIIDEANLRFRHMQPNAPTFTNALYGADTEIEMCLVDTDPDGNYTSGVTRHYDPTRSTASYNDVFPYFRDNYHWDNSKYYNMYIMTEMTNAAGVYISGSFDATIYNGGGGFWSGLICHETGHYFTLGHTFNTENSNACPTNTDCLTSGDRVCDTPPKFTSGYAGGSCAAPANTCSTDEADLSTNNPYRPTANGGMGDQPDMSANYLDYTGGCWDAFTEGQKARMRMNIADSRTSQTGSVAMLCTNRALPANDAGITAMESNSTPCFDSFTPTLTLKNYGSADLTSVKVTIEVNGSVIRTDDLNLNNLATDATQTISLSAPITITNGSSLIKLTTSLPNAAADGNEYNDEAYSTVFYAENGSVPTPVNFANCNLPTGWTADEWSLAETNSYASCQACAAYILVYGSSYEDYSLQPVTYDLRNFSAPKLRFKVGYIPRYTFIDNTLSVAVSSECGTVSTPYSKSGSTLGTGTPAEAGAYELPECSEFRTETIDLSTFGGDKQVIINFVANGRWYSPLMLDDVEIFESAALPLQILDFSAQEENEHVKLSWSTTEEYNVDYFNLERSLDGKNYDFWKKVAATEKRSAGANHNYETNDDQKINGIRYYRLTAVDNDGSNSKSLITSLQTTTKSAFKIYPNPNQSRQLTIELPTTTATIQIQIMDVMGKVVFQQNFTDNAAFSLSLNVADLPNGTYFLQSRTDGERWTERVVLY